MVRLTAPAWPAAPGLDDVNPKHFEGLVAGLGVVNGAFRDLVGFAGLDFHRRLAVDDEFKLALEHVAGFGARMGMAAGGAAGGNFRDRGDGVVAGREIELLQRRALDAACWAMAHRAGECDDGQSEQSVAIAQQSGIKRTPLQKLDFPAGYNTVTAIAEVPAGGAGAAIHPGARNRLCA